MYTAGAQKLIKSLIVIVMYKRLNLTGQTLQPQMRTTGLHSIHIKIILILTHNGKTLHLPFYIHHLMLLMKILMIIHCMHHIHLFFLKELN